MIKVSVMYPFEPDARFDHDYYRDRHMPLVQRLLGKACASYAIDKGLSGGEKGSPPIYVGMCHIFSESAAIFEAGMADHGAEIFADVTNYTDIAPIIQVSDVVVDVPAGVAA